MSWWLTRLRARHLVNWRYHWWCYQCFTNHPKWCCRYTSFPCRICCNDCDDILPCSRRREHESPMTIICNDVTVMPLQQSKTFIRTPVRTAFVPYCKPQTCYVISISNSSVNSIRYSRTHDNVRSWPDEIEIRTIERRQRNTDFKRRSRWKS